MRNTRARGDKLINMNIADYSSRKLKRVYLNSLDGLWYGVYAKYPALYATELATEKAYIQRMKRELERRGYWFP